MPPHSVLLVDEDAPIREVMCEAFLLAGHTVEVPADGEAALRTLAELWPSLIVLDLFMPGMDGWRFLEAYRVQQGTTPVLVLSAVLNLEQARDRQAVEALLSKPCEITELLDVTGRLTAGEPPARSLPG